MVKVFDEAASHFLYEESLLDEVRTFLHCEPLVVKSEKHDWKINPHRHRSIYQLFVVNRGGVEALIDGQTHWLKSPFLMLIPDGVVHGFNWEVGSTGYVVSVTTTALSHALQNIGLLDVVSKSLIVPLSSSDIEQIEGCCESINLEIEKCASFKDTMLLTLLQQLLIIAYRSMPVGVNKKMSLTKPEQKIEEFNRLVKENFTRYHQVAWYADYVGVSAAHLNHICKLHLDTTALGHIHKYLLEEAKRLLIFADMRITSIADKLGFSEQTYFTKFFKKQTGYTPSSFRRHFR